MSTQNHIKERLEPQKDQLIESVGDGIMIGYRLQEARENFCGSLIDDSLTREEVYKYYNTFVKRLDDAMFNERSSCYIGEKLDTKVLSSKLMGQIACVNTLKSNEMTIDQVEDVVDMYSSNYLRLTWQEIAISSLNHIVLPYIEARSSVDLT